MPCQTYPKQRQDRPSALPDPSRMWFDGDMLTVELRKWSVTCEPDLTREAYAQIDSGGAERCGCEECFNFAAVRHLIYPPDLLELFECMGIDPLLEADVEYRCPVSNGQHGYCARFFLVGRIASGPTTTTAQHGSSLAPSLEETGGSVAVGFSQEPDALPNAFHGLPTVCFEVAIVAPWVSNAPEPY